MTHEAFCAERDGDSRKKRGGKRTTEEFGLIEAAIAESPRVKRDGKDVVGEGESG